MLLSVSYKLFVNANVVDQMKSQ